MEQLIVLREDRGLSRSGLATLSRLNPATVHRIENGERSPTVETLEKLAEALEVEVADFFPKAQAPLPLDFGVVAGRREDEDLSRALGIVTEKDSVALFRKSIDIAENALREIGEHRQPSPSTDGMTPKELELLRFHIGVASRIREKAAGEDSPGSFPLQPRTVEGASGEETYFLLGATKVSRWEGQLPKELSEARTDPGVFKKWAKMVAEDIDDRRHFAPPESLPLPPGVERLEEPDDTTAALRELMKREDQLLRKIGEGLREYFSPAEAERFLADLSLELAP